MPKYQVQHKNNSRTFNDIFEANSHIEIIDFFQNILNTEITEIKEIIYVNPIYPKDDNNYIKSVSCFLKGSQANFQSIKIPKLKKSIKDDQLTNLIKAHIKVNNKPPISVRFTYII
ncbi:MAG: hypothetical protein ACI81I_000819 [Arcobacteraceae bacterium]|jgi:hypothetical protein